MSRSQSGPKGEIRGALSPLRPMAWRSRCTWVFFGPGFDNLFSVGLGVDGGLFVSFSVVHASAEAGAS